MKSKHIDIVRDVAIFLEKDDLQISIDLISLALKARPNGSILKKKNYDYLKEISPSDSYERSLIKALRLVEPNEELFFDFLNFVDFYLPDNKAVEGIKNRNIFYINLKRELNDLRLQIELLRNKFVTMHQGLVHSGAFKVKEIDDYAAKLSPVEFFDKGAEETLIVFGGMATRPSMPPKEFFASFMLKKINIIFVKDFQQCWYQNGLVGLTSDIESTVLYLKSLIPHQTKKLTCLGTSAGGYASIRFGVSLNADRILSFSPQTKINDAIFEKFKSLDSRIDEVDFNYNSDLDLALFLSSVKYKGKIELFVGKENKQDYKAANKLSEFSTIYSFPTGTHNIAGFMKKNGLLDSVLSSI